MSLSDPKKHSSPADRAGNGVSEEPFRPIDVRSLDRFQDEVSLRTPDAEPDFERFKLLFDPSELSSSEGPVTFEALYSFVKDDTDQPFEPLIKGAGTPTPAPDANAAEQEAGEPEEVVPEKTPEEIGFETGYAKGIEAGRKQGFTEGEAKGFDEGFARGQKEGFAEGQAEGSAKGEAEGLEKGGAEGRAKAEEEVRTEASKILEPLRQSLESVDTLLDRLVTRYEVQILELICKIAEKAVMAKLHTDDEVVKFTILDALKSLVAPEEIVLSVSAEDYEYVQMIKDEFFGAVQSLKHVAVSSDPMIERGGCRIETATATIATDPKTKLAAVYDALVKVGIS